MSDLEEKAFDDLDAIAELADAGLQSLAAGKLDGVEDTLRGIEDLADAWSDSQ